MCTMTNHNFIVETIEKTDDASGKPEGAGVVVGGDKTNGDGNGVS